MDEITAQLEIDAPPDVVWDVLTDFEAYPEWNPILTIAGAPSEGERLTVTFTYPHQRSTTVTPRVVTANAPTDFRWQGRLFVPWLYDVEHRFVLAPLDGGARTRLTQGETFSGILVGLINWRIGSDVETGFEQMNQRLRAHVETGDAGHRQAESTA